MPPAHTRPQTQNHGTSYGVVRYMDGKERGMERGGVGGGWDRERERARAHARDEDGYLLVVEALIRVKGPSFTPRLPRNTSTPEMRSFHVALYCACTFTCVQSCAHLSDHCLLCAHARESRLAYACVCVCVCLEYTTSEGSDWAKTGGRFVGVPGVRSASGFLYHFLVACSSLMHVHSVGVCVAPEFQFVIAVSYL
jgi:hypothetical protein